MKGNHIFTVQVPNGPMFPVRGIHQERRCDKSGQCTEAAYATVLGVPLDAIPDLYTGDPENPRSDERWMVMHDYMRIVHGRIIVTCRFKPRSLPLNIPKLEDDLKANISNLPWRTSLHVLGGLRDGVGHSIVGYMGKPVWDPDPKGRGLPLADSFTFLMKIDELKVSKELLDAGMGAVIWNLEDSEHRIGE